MNCAGSFRKAGFLLVALLSACATKQTLPNPPNDRLDFPGSIVYAALPDGGEVLYVANANLDVGYGFGSVMSVSLSGLPAFGFSPATPVNVHDISFTDSDGGILAGTQVFIDGFSGLMAVWPTPAGLRLFVPTRQSNNLFAVDATGVSLSCVVPEASNTPVLDCTTSPITLFTDGGATGQIRQEQPYDAIVVGSSLFVSPLQAADDPKGSQTNFATFLARLDPNSPFGSVNFFLAGQQSVYEMASAGGNVYMTSAYQPAPGVTTIGALPLRQFDPVAAEERAVYLNPTVDTTQAKGLVASCDGTKIYVITEAPDALATLDIGGASYAGQNATSVIVPVLRLDPLPQGPAEIYAICRPGQGDLLAIASISSNSLALYDTDAAAVVSTLRGFAQPYGLAVATGGRYAPGARIFVTAFQRGTIDVVDVPNLASPDTAVLVAHLGCPYVCTINPDDPECAGAPVAGGACCGSGTPDRGCCGGAIPNGAGGCCLPSDGGCQSL